MKGRVEKDVGRNRLSGDEMFEQVSKLPDIGFGTIRERRKFMDL